MSRPTSADSDGRVASPTGLGSTPSTNRLSGKPMGPEKLLDVTEQVYKTFNPARVTLDTHADNSILKLQVVNSFDDTFIRQVFYGVVRYRQFLGSLLDSFYFYNGGMANRDDRDMYKHSAYLTIFRLKELGFSSFRRLVAAKEPQKMLVFFKYLFDERFLREAVRDEWLKLYDKEFVDTTISQLLVWKSDMAELIDSLEDKVYLNRKKSEEKEAALSAGAGSATHRNTAKISAPFNLSQPRPKPLPVEDPPPPPIRIKPPPKIKDGPTKDELAIMAAKEANRKASEDKFPASLGFRLTTLERPTNLERIRAEIEADMARELTFRTATPKPAPAPSIAPVKLNTAAILREDALYRKKQIEEAEMLKQFESELRDASEFKSWQTRMLSMDEEARAASVERRRVEMQDSQEAAIRARQNKVDENLATGRQAKAEARRIESDLAREKEGDMRMKQAMMQSVMDSRAGIAHAAEKLAIEKRLAAEDDRQRQVNDAKTLAEAEIRDLAEKRDIIMQLRALEKAPRIRVNEFDPTTAPDFGLHEQMTLMELRERLHVAKRRAKEEEERQRSLILQSKADKEAMIMDKASNIQRIRMAAAAQAHVRKSRTQAEAKTKSDQSAYRQESDVLALHSKLEAKRSAAAAEKSRLAIEEKKIKFEQMQQAAGASAVEEAKFRELREGAKREAFGRQTDRAMDAHASEGTKSKAQNTRMRNMKADKRETTDFLAAYDAKLAQMAMASSQEAAADFSHRSNLALSQREFEANARNRMQTTAYVPSTGRNTTNIAARLAQLPVLQCGPT